MRFRDLADLAAALEATRARRRMVELTAALLGRAAPADRARIVYLLQGQLRPAYEGVELGLGERLLVDVLARLTGASTATLRRRLGVLGDIGLVAEERGLARRGKALTIAEVHAGLLAVAGTSGTGSVEGKARHMVALLARATPLEARFLLRIAQGRLRLGMGDQTILEAAALGALGDRAAKGRLEELYNVRSDLGAVVRLAFEGRGKRLVVTPVPGVPVRPALAQRLPSARAIVERLGRVRVEPKYDGFRLQLHRDGAKVWAFSRRLEDVTAMFPELVTACRRQLTARRAILEGEAVSYDPETGEFFPFQVTMTRKRKHAVDEARERSPLRLFAFDLLLAGRESCLGWPQKRRSEALARLLRGGAEAPIQITPSLTTDKAKAVENYFDEMVGRGLEGIVAKRIDAPYRAGARGYDWVKLKRAYQSHLRDTVDLVLVGYFRGRGRRAGTGIGSLLGATYDPKHDRYRTLARIGSGLTEEGWRSLRRRLDRDAVRTRP
ncbi:MAG TPA: ATP-dependent DNA ligase, partial [Gemmatimonadales bacterium]|nr:ATP-dependent DNA ligase [Gemmatimonadales bacterium]